MVGAVNWLVRYLLVSMIFVHAARNFLLECATFTAFHNTTTSYVPDPEAHLRSTVFKVPSGIMPRPLNAARFGD